MACNRAIKKNRHNAPKTGGAIWVVIFICSEGNMNGIVYERLRHNTPLLSVDVFLRSYFWNHSLPINELKVKLIAGHNIYHFVT